LLYIYITDYNEYLIRSLDVSQPYESPRPVTGIAFYHCKIRFWNPVLDPNTSPFLQTTLAADADTAEGQFLLMEQTLNAGRSLIYRAGNRKPSLQKRRAAFRTKVDLKKEQCIEVKPPRQTITITTKIKT
jgi:hypothetical protein